MPAPKEQYFCIRNDGYKQTENNTATSTGTHKKQNKKTNSLHLGKSWRNWGLSRQQQQQ